MLRIAFTCLFTCVVALGLLLAGVADVDAQKKKRRGKRKAAPAPSAQAAEPDGTAKQEAGAQPAPGSDAQPSKDGAPAAEMVVTPEEAEAATSGDVAGDASGSGATAPDGSAPVGAAVEQAAQADAELAGLRQELSAVMDELVQARALVSMLGKALFKTRVRIMVEDEATPDQQVARIALYLDGAPVFRGDDSSIPADPAHPVFEGFAAPGPHELTLELEHRARDDDAYRYTLRNTFRFEVVRGHRTDLRLVLDDDSDMAEDFADDREGQYEVESRLEVQAEPLQD